MGELIATTGPDLMSGDNNDVSADYYGEVMLSSRNLIPDPGLQRYDEETKKHKYWEMGEPKRPTHWTLFVRDRNTVQQSSKQIASPLPLSTNVFDLEDELVRGPGPLEKSRAEDIAEPAAPRAELITMPQTGYPAGFYTIAFGWIQGPFRDSKRVTPPGPRSPGPGDEPMELAEGQGFLITLPAEIPEDVTGIAIYLSEPRTSHLSAVLAPMFLVARVSVKAGTRQYARLVGPPDTRWRANEAVNMTYVGNRNDLAALDVNNIHSRYGRQGRASVRFAYRIATRSGLSQRTRPTDWFDMPAGHNGISFRPKSFPEGTIGWIPQVQWKHKEEDEGSVETSDVKGAISSWHNIVNRGGGGGNLGAEIRARVAARRPDDWKNTSDDTDLEEADDGDEVDDAEEDNTGSERPTEPLDSPIILELNSSGLTPGPHWVKTALMVKDREGPAGPEKRIDVNDNGAIRVMRPLYHNRMDNADLGERLPNDKDLPRGWEILRPYPGTATCTVKDQWLEFVDKTNGNTNYPVFRTPLAFFETDEDKYTIRYTIAMSEYIEGRFRVAIQCYNNADQKIGDDIEVDSYFDNQEVTPTIRISRNNDDVGSPAVVKIPNNTVQIKLIGRAVGDGKAGQRNYKIDFHHFGVFEGWGEPRKVDMLEQGRVSQRERDEDAYPHGGYCVVVEENKNRPKWDNYENLDKKGFESGDIPARFTSVKTGQTGSLVQEITKAASISGEYGLLIQKTAAGAGMSQNYITKQMTDTGDQMSLAFDFSPDASTDGTYDIAEILDNSGNRMAAIRYNSATGALQAAAFTGGNPTWANIARGLEKGDKVSPEIFVQDGGSAGGTLIARVGDPRRERSEVYVRNGINWTGQEPRIVRMGVTRDDAANSTWKFYFDDIHASRNGTGAYTTQDGNYIEYYGPKRTPKNLRYGPYGMKIPARPNQTYTIGANVWGRDVTAGTDILRLRAMSRDHEVLRVYDPVVTNVGGNFGWKRESRTINTPNGTAYIEFFGNNIGGGTIRIHGIQFEKGSNATQFTMRHNRSGWLKLFFSTVPEGMSTQDNMYRLTRVSEIRKITHAITDNINTSYSVQYRGGASVNSLGAYVGHHSELNPESNVIEVKVNLTSNNDLDTPIVRDIRVDLARYDSILCRENGTEYKGGVLVNNIGGVHAPPRSENIELASGELMDAPWGTKRVQRITADIHCFRRSTLEEIVRNKTHIIESPDRRYKVKFEDAPQFDTRVQTRKYITHDDEFFQHYAAEGVTFWIERMEKL